MIDAALTLSDSARRTALREPPDLEQVFARYLDPVYRFLYSRVGNREDAEDLTSEVFLKATRQLDSARAEASVAQWLFTVARTVLADHWRRYYKSGSILPLDDARLGETPELTQPPGLSDSSVRLVSQILDRLSPRYRAVLELRFLRGYTIEETARELELTVVNVKVIQHRALIKAVELAGDRM